MNKMQKCVKNLLQNEFVVIGKNLCYTLKNALSTAWCRLSDFKESVKKPKTTLKKVVIPIITYNYLYLLLFLLGNTNNYKFLLVKLQIHTNSLPIITNSLGDFFV